MKTNPVEKLFQQWYYNGWSSLRNTTDNVRRVVPCTVPVVCYIRSQVVAAGAAMTVSWRQGAYSYLRMLSCHSATAYNGS